MKRLLLVVIAISVSVAAHAGGFDNGGGQEGNKGSRSAIHVDCLGGGASGAEGN